MKTKHRKKTPLLDQIINILINCIVIPYKFIIQISLGLIFGPLLIVTFLLGALLIGVAGIFIAQIFGLQVDINKVPDIFSVGIAIGVFLVFYYLLRTLFREFGWIKNIRRIKGSHPLAFQKFTVFLLATSASLLQFFIAATIGLYFKPSPYAFFHPAINGIFNINFHKANYILYEQLLDDKLANLLANGLPFVYFGEMILATLILIYYFTFVAKWVTVRRVGTSVSVDDGSWHQDLD